jgi:hypothetical protein
LMRHLVQITVRVAFQFDNSGLLSFISHLIRFFISHCSMRFGQFVRLLN